MKTPQQRRRACRMIAGGASIQSALVANGWSPKQAKKGRKALGPEMISMIEEEWQKMFGELEKMGAAVTPAQQERVVRGRLLRNLLTGEDKATQSAKLLGSERTLNMWQSESQTGIIVIGGTVQSGEDQDPAKLLPE